ncbi:MAG: lipid-A-disaccharide synthase [Pararhodobacter sp.]|nr:lipid-A-disaccharide synthase [Pararhodobacter sp.]
MKVYLIAGESSGDALGGALMQGLRSLAPEVRFAGIGGPLMQAEGLHSLFPMDELSIMGLAEILPKYLHLKRRIRETAQAIVAQAPDVVITIDSPDFCLRVLALARAANPALKTVHYVAPSVWAWRPGRAVKMARVVDHVLALLPFEPPYMTRAGMRCDFVGHPVTTQPVADEAAAAAFRAAQGIDPDAPVILALPGSRRGEVARLGPVFGAALHRVLGAHPSARVIVPSVAARAEQVRALVAQWPGDPLVLDAGQSTAGTKRAAFRAADAALAASGTVSLELAAADTPMVIAYRLNALSEALITRLLRVDTVTLVNLVSETRAIPEFLGAACQPESIATALSGLLAGGADREAQRAAMAVTMQRLGRGGEAPGLRAARSVLAFLEASPAPGLRPAQSSGA